MQYDGCAFNPFSNEGDDGPRAALKFGFRSKALSLEVRLALRSMLVGLFCLYTRSVLTLADTSGEARRAPPARYGPRQAIPDHQAGV